MLCGTLIFVVVWITVSGDCPFFDHEMLNGKFIYREENDQNLTLAPSNYILRFECDKGYKLTEPQFIYCGGDEWNDEFPRCLMLDCPKPPEVEHANFEIEKGTIRNPIVGSQIVYTCNIGYEMANASASSLSCVLEDNTAIWKGVLPHCTEKRTCADPGVSHYGYRKGSCCTTTECACSTGDVLTFSCRQNYQLVGDNSIICLLGGNWSAPKPRCRPQKGVCPDPPTIENGVVKISAGVKVGDYYTANDEVEVVCDPGYAFYGDTEYVYCEDNLEWDAEFGKCKITFCSRPDMLANGSIVELENNNAIEFANGVELTYVCDDGFKFYSHNHVRECKKGKWSGKEPQCEKIRCYDPGTPEYGTKSGSDFSVGSKVIFNCFSGYDVIGSVERHCLPNGQWSGELARCNLKSNHCPNPGIPINGKRMGDGFDEGNRVTFFCQDGFKLIGSNVSQCLPDGSWSGEEARCLGSHDFDNENDISDMLKLTIEERTEVQAIETEMYETVLEEIRNGTVVNSKTIDLNYPGRLVLYFLFDVSGSVKKKNFDASIKFAQALVTKIGISKNGARVGALTFSSKANTQFYAPHYTTTEEVLEALGKIKYEKGGTATSSALQVVREEMIPIAREHLGYKNMKSIIFLLTDGRANTGGNPKIQGDLLKAEGVEIYCIGITGDIKKNELYQLASLPLEEHVFVLKNYLVLDWLVQEITNGTIDFSQCGLAAKRSQRPRVIGGEEVIEPWPWMAALYFRRPRSYNLPSELRCGASIINPQWILTAAHCLKKDQNVAPTTDVTIKLGLTNVGNVTMLQEFEAEKIIIHPEYEDDQTFDYDIALMKMSRLIEYNRYVRPICLPPKNLSPASPLYKPNENAFATGWGYTKPLKPGEKVGPMKVDILKELLLPLQKRDVCLQSLEDQGVLPARFTERMFCAGVGDGKEDTCLGDSGGPLMQMQVNEEGSIYWSQVGIVSWGIGCSQVNTYGFYTNVHKFLPWIHSVVTEDKV